MNFRLAIDAHTILRIHRPVYFLRMLCDSLIPVFFKSDSLRLIASRPVCPKQRYSSRSILQYRARYLLATITQHVEMAFARTRKPAALDDHMKLVL